MQQTRSWFQSGSLVQSLMTGIAVAAPIAGLSIISSMDLRGMAGYQRGLIVGSLQLIVTTFLVTVVLEQRRARAIRRTLDLAFLNHHVRNALVQIAMSEYVSDVEKHRNLLDDAVSRISETLFRVANSANLKELSLERDLTGLDLIRESGERAKAGKGAA